MRGNMMDVGTWVALGAFALNLVGTLVGLIWKLSRVEVSLRQTIQAERKEIDKDLEKQSREFGETAAALRQKVTEVELYMRDNFVRRDGFYKVRDELSQDIKHLGEQLHARLERMEAKIDHQ